MSDKSTRLPFCEVLHEAAQRLTAAGIDSAPLDAQMLMGHALAMSCEQLVSAAKVPLDDEQVTRFNAILQRRLQREPLAYIIGRKEFWSLGFLVTADVLIPRPETERLIEVVLALVAQLRGETAPRVADLGTGSGAIAVSLAKELAAARIWASDSSVSALAVAQRNAEINGVADRITFWAGDLFEAFSVETEGFDLIVRNPPYIQTDRIAALEPEISRWEPRTALDGGADGLEFYRRIATQARQFLKPCSAVAVEIGAEMGNEVVAIFNQAGGYRDAAVYQDYAGRDRVVVAKCAVQVQRST